MSLVIDSRLSLIEALDGSSAPASVLKKQCLVEVEYVGFDGLEHGGQIVINQELKTEVSDIFKALKDLKFPIEKVIPVSAYSWSDERSMADNNSSGFNFRYIKDKDQLSHHAYGRAIDINPKLNPYINKEGETVPSGSQYDEVVPGTIIIDGDVVKLFESYGWEWGGRWGKTRGYYDYHHFEKPE